jgi:hypothetical protein
MIESPLLQELSLEQFTDRLRETLMNVLIARFGSKAQSLETELKTISEEPPLQELFKHAATCRTLSSFRKHLSP